jgi:hypothetical protein
MYRTPTSGARRLAALPNGAPMPPNLSLVPAACPAWCTTEHGVFVGEDDDYHLGAPLHLTPEVMVRLCATVDRGTGVTEGPYVIVSSDDSDDEWTLERTRDIGEALIALVDAAQPSTGGQPRAGFESPWLTASPNSSRGPADGLPFGLSSRFDL